MSKSFSISIKLTDSSHRVAKAMLNPVVWQAYKLRVLNLITEGVKSSIQRNAANGWRNPTGALDNAWFTTINPSSMTGRVVNTKKYAYYQNFGVKPHQMTYVLNSELRTYAAWGGKGTYQARPPIPMHVNGGILFRRPTLEQIQAGKWQHPGYPGKSFVQHGVEDYRTNIMPAEISGLLLKIVENNG